MLQQGLKSQSYHRQTHGDGPLRLPQPPALDGLIGDFVSFRTLAYTNIEHNRQGSHKQPTGEQDSAGTLAHFLGSVKSNGSVGYL